MSRSSIIVSHSLAADNSNPTAVSREPWRFYFTSVKYNMSASPAQATGLYPCASTWTRHILDIQFTHGLAVSDAFLNLHSLFLSLRSHAVDPG
jgi:hypothetical protein